MSGEPILFVGDIQGCSSELALLLDRAGFRPGRHRLIPVGDTINRGPDAPGVLRQLREAQAEPILGNHERHLLAVARRRERGEWRKQGSAFDQLLGAGELEAAVAWIETWPLFREEEDWIAVHAGLHPRLPPAETPADFLTEVRFCTEAGERPRGADGKLLAPPPGFGPWYDFYRGPRTVIFGHWARLGLFLRGPLRGLDSGCVYGGPLTGLWWPEDRVVQVPSGQPYRRLPGAS
jgi:bis(5'-nucleosyl)-tetraphosphatase (symmetrical)